MSAPSPPPGDSDYLRFCLASAADPVAAVSALAAEFEPIQPRAIMLFASSNLEQIAAGLNAQFPDCPTIGCSTAGEISEGAFSTGTVSAIALGSPARAATRPVTDLTEFRYEQGAEILAGLCTDLGVTHKELVSEADRFVFVILADGLSGMEEVLIASLMVLVPDVKLVGGSAGDNFVFEKTQVACSGEVHSHGAVVMLLEPGVPYHTFVGHHYKPTDQTVVVTSADPEKRLIHRIDGKPANLFAATTLGLSLHELAADEINAPLNNPIVLGMRQGDSEQYFNRTVMRVSGSSILMGGAIEEGAILTVMRPSDLLEHSKQSMQVIRDSCNRPLGQVLFDCGGRIGLARDTNQTAELAQIVAYLPTAGFTTYGEFFGPLLLNHTLAGIIFDGSPNES